MFNPQMLDPALLSFFKQAGEAFKLTAEAEAAGRMAKALQKHCGTSVPPEQGAPGFGGRCLLYAAKGFAMAHIDGEVTWGGIKALLAQSRAWPPPADLQTQGALFQSFLLGFLYGSELPESRQQSIEQLIPMGARIASDPASFAQSMGLDPSMLGQMAEKFGKGGAGGGLSALMGMFNKNKT